ncbi:MAG: glycine cleavage system aminomethyltransferase GcvT [Rhodospirillales bacterium]|jgi:aminomethyltransferase
MTNPSPKNLSTTPLDELHRELGARMVPFAGYAMPVQYSSIIAEHNHTRKAASLFDVSHMGQAILRGDNPLAEFEKIVPADLQELTDSQQRYTMLTHDSGGILDDLMVSRAGETLRIVVNAACKETDFDYIKKTIGRSCELEILFDRALLALQGPKAASILHKLSPDLRSMPFMSTQEIHINGIPCFISRSGYTGEDGFEISVAAENAEKLARMLLDESEVLPAGLGARDSLRLEAGLCLYGSDIDKTTTPIEAGLTWTIGKRRRSEGGFPGDTVILEQIATGTDRNRVGIQPEGRAPVRAHSEISDTTGVVIGEITSGGFGPTVNAPVAMGYVANTHREPGTSIQLSHRNKTIPGKIVKLPFVKHRYFKV